MRKRLKKGARFSQAAFLWAAGVFFFLGGLAYMGQSIFAAILMLLLSLLLLPPVWKRIKQHTPFNERVRVIAVIVLFFTAVAVTPPSEEATVATKKDVPVANVSETKTNVRKTDQAEAIKKMSYEDGGYVVAGTGLANTTYQLEFSESPRADVTTNDKGEFSYRLADTTQVFGEMSLKRDTNGAWFGGVQTYDTAHFVLNEEASRLDDDQLEPVILGISGTATVYEVSGYYTPKATIVLKSGDALLGKTKVDRSGRFQFTNVTIPKNYTEVSLHQLVSSGWFSSREEKRGATRYLDTVKKSVLRELPIVTREESKTEVITFGERAEQSSAIAKGETKVTQEGANGEKRIFYSVTYRGNDEISRSKVREEVTRPAVDKVTATGTYVAPTSKPAQQKTNTQQWQFSGPATPPASVSTYYKNCSAARAAGAAPVYAGQPGYGRHLDRDGDGIGCE